MNSLKQFSRFLFRFTWHIVVVIALLLIGLHFWFVHNSEKTIEDLVTWASNGKLKSEIKKFRINYLDNNIDIKDLRIFNTDSSRESTAYYFSVQNFHLKIRSKWALLFHRQLIVDSVIFNAPEIVVTRKGVQQDTTTAKSKLLLAEELGNVYKTINQSLSVLHLQRFEINEGHVLIRDGDSINRAPFRLSHIFLSIDKLNIDSAGAATPANFVLPDRILLRITDQNILLPDNKSTVAFKELLIDSKKRFVRIIKPAVNILPLAVQQSNLIASADLLNITGLDFDALYQRQLIKADSVFVEKADGRFELYTNAKKDKVGKKKTTLDSTLYNLPVSVAINHIVMQHGNGIIYLHQNEKTTTFQTKNDNISVEGVRINDSLGNLLNIDGFYYTIRNYVGYTMDSIYRFRFDSLQFINNKIVLHHFTTTTVKQQKATLIRDYVVPRLEISGFDWITFIFENHFSAHDAILFNPVLHIEKNNVTANNDSSNSGNKKSIYQTLSVMDSILDLKQLQIVHGNFSFKESSSISMQLQNLNLNINADALTKAKSINQLVGSVNLLAFDTATANNASASLFIGKSAFNKKEKVLVLKDVILRADNEAILVNLSGVALGDFSFDKNELDVNGINWREGSLHFSMDAKDKNELKKQGNTPALFLNNITGNNTKVVFENEKIKASFFFKNISANGLFKEVDKPFKLDGFWADGNAVDANFADGKFQCASFTFRDNKGSQLRNILFEKKTQNDTIVVRVPAISFIPSVNQSISGGNITLDSLQVQRPEITFIAHITASTPSGSPIAVSVLPLNISNFSLDDASVLFHLKNTKNDMTAQSDKISLRVKNIAAQKENTLFIDHADFTAAGVMFKQNDSVTLAINDKATIAINAFTFQPSTKVWQLNAAQFISGAIEYKVNRSRKDENRFFISNLSAKNISVSSSDLKQPAEWLVNASGANLQMDSVRLKNEHTHLAINNFQFDQKSKYVELGSFSIDPGKDKEGFVNSLTYRKDFMQAYSGKIMIKGIEMKNGSLIIPQITIDNALLNVYSDKLVKAGTESFQPLPAPAVKIIPAGLEIKKINLNNMRVNYSELNSDTRKTGDVFFTKISGTISNIATRHDQAMDSLEINVRARFLDTLPMQLSLNESYGDSLSGLALHLQLGPGQLGLMNAFLVPLVSMQARSGKLDTMSLTAFGNDYEGHGNMRLYFNNLKAEILDSGNITHRKFGTKFLNFLANTFAIRKRNKSKSADFTFVRIRYKSSISYFLKIIVEGAARNVAPLSRILLRKKNKAELEQAATLKL